MDGKKTPATVPKTAIPAADRRAIEWALLTACFPVVSYAVAYALAHDDAACSESVPLTVAQDAELSALWFGMLCCATLQAAAAALALLLPCRRRSLTHAALAVTMGGATIVFDLNDDLNS